MAQAISNQDLKRWFRTRIRIMRMRIADIDDLIANGDKYNDAHRGEVEARISNYFTNEFWDAYDNLPNINICLLYTSPSPRDRTRSRMPSSA